MQRRAGLQALCIALALSIVSCSSKGSQPTNGVHISASAKRYHLKGKVVSVDKQAKTVTVDHEAIPGFMAAMAMPYNVKPERELDRLSPGASITADVVVDNDEYWLENVAITQPTP